MTIHPEDAMSYADQLHRDLADVRDGLGEIASALKGISELLGLSLDGERAFSVRQVGAVVFREDRP